MTDTNPKVLAMVERALKKDSDLKSTELRERAIKIDKKIEKLSGRQFHARYVIQVRKRLFGSKTKKRTRKKSTRSGRPKTTDTASSFLAATFEEKKSELQAAIDAAFDRAMARDSVKEIDKLLASLEKHTHEFEKA